MNALDLGAPVVPLGTCPRCDLGDRPLWATDELTACASCWTRHRPDAAITFHAGRGPITARQDTLPGLVA